MSGLSVTAAGVAADAVEEHLPALVEERFASRLFDQDATLWGPDAQDEASKRLSWVGLARGSRHLVGDESLHAQLVDDVTTWAPRGKNFLGHLSAQVVAHEPPLGFFRGFVVARAGEHKDTLDLKRGGVGLIVDLARVHALRTGLVSVNTRSRLLAAGRAGAISEGAAESLVDALEFISHVRLVHQSRQAVAGSQPDSRLRPDELTAFERRTLREAFHVVREAQQALAQQSSTRFFS